MGAVLVVLILLGGWQLYTTAGGIDPIILPSPTDIATSLWDDRALLWSQFLVTAKEMLLGLAVAGVVGVLFAVALHLSPTLRRALYPLLIGSQTVPIPILAPLFIVWFGYALLPKVLIVALVCFFPVVVATLDALDASPPGQDRLLRSMGATRWQRLRHAEGPGAVPGLLTGLRLSVAVAAIAAVLAEQAGSSEGLGHLITQAIPQLDTARAWAAVVVLSAFAVALFLALALVERRFVPWSHRTRGTRP